MDITVTIIMEEVNNPVNLNFHRDALFGDGFFTTAVIKDGCIIHKERHLSRLQESAQRLKFEHWNIDSLSSTLNDIVEKYSNSIIRVSCSRKQKERGYAISSNSQIYCDIAVQKLVEFKHNSCHLKFAETPISVNSMLAGIKHLNRLDNVLAASECETPDQEVLMCDGERVISGSRTNLFVKLDGQWFTPTISNCGINGITQNVVIDTMNDLGIDCLYKDIYRKDFEKISSVFVTNSIVGIWPAKMIETTQLDWDCVMKLKQKLKVKVK